MVKKLRQSLQLLSAWSLSLIGVVGILFFTFVAFLLHLSSEQQYLAVKSERIATSVSRTLAGAIRYQASVLEVLGHATESLKAEAYEELAISLIENYPAFYSINIVSPDGKITDVFPIEKNQVALGKNLLERDDVRKYLIDAKTKKIPQMSHKLMTYQGVPAFTLYVPIFKNEKFVGWLNGVIDFENWLADFLKTHDYSNARVIVSWDHPDSSTVDQGPQTVKELFTFEHAIENQKILLKIGFAQDGMDRLRSQNYRWMVFLGLLLLLFALVAVISLQLSKLKLREANENLSLKNKLLSSVTHDLATPLMTLGIMTDQLMSGDQPITPTMKERIRKTLQSMAEILTSAKILHAQKLGISKIRTNSTLLSSAVSEAIALVTDSASAKKLTFHIADSEGVLPVEADLRTLVNNVLMNVLTNAIKFSPEGSQISISFKKLKNQTHLIIDDQGTGFTKEQIKKLERTQHLDSTTGTLGEKGTGLGWLQIYGFMMSYGGAVEIENVNHTGGARVILIFQNFSDKKGPQVQ